MATPGWRLVHGLAIALSLSTFVMSCSGPNTNVAFPDVTTGSENSQAQQPVSQSISIDGSSTVYPLTDEAVKEYQFEREDEPQIKVTTNTNLWLDHYLSTSMCDRSRRSPSWRSLWSIT